MICSKKGEPSEFIASTVAPRVKCKHIPKAKQRGFEFHLASSARESVAHQILLSSTCRRGVPHGRTATASALSLLRCFRGPRAGARLPCQRTSTADRSGPYGTRAITWRWSRWCRRQIAQTKTRWWNLTRQRWIP